MKFRKLVIALTAIVLMLMSTMTVFAAEDPTVDVTGSYAGENGTPVYAYSYKFGNMKFSWSDAATGEWNPETHEFEGTGESKGGWTCATGSDEITVVNHSNAPVQVQLTFQSALSGVQFGFTEPVFDLKSAVGTGVDEAPSYTVHVAPMKDTGGLSAGQTNVKIGTVTLHVSPK